MHARWSTFVDKFPYKIVHKLGQHNQVADALSTHVDFIKTLSVEIVGFECLKELYVANDDFKHVWEQCMPQQPSGEFYVHEGFS